MSKKVIRAVGIVAGVVAVVATMGSGLGVLLGGAGMMLVGVGSAASIAMVAGAVSLGAQLLGGSKKPSVPEQSTNRLYANLDPQAPRKIVFGTTAMATDIRYQAYTGANQQYLNWIIACASHRVEEISEIWFDSQMVWSKAGGINSAAFDPWFVFIDVREEGSAANVIAIDGTWNTSARLTGCAYVFIRFLLTQKTSSQPSPFASSVPTRITIVGSGMPVPDIRIPGVDPEDQDTWVFGESGRNPALQHLAYRLGWRINGELAVGQGMPVSRLDLDSYITAANLCDETVTLAAGGTEPRYRCDGVVSESDDPDLVLGNLEAAMNAVARDSNGALGLDVLHNELAAPIAYFDESDIIGEDLWEQTAPLSESFNIVRGRFADPGSLYQLVEYPEVALDSVDGIDRIDPFDLPMVQSPSQAQRLAKQRLQRAQYQGTFSAVFTARAWQVSLGRIVALGHAFLGFDDKLFRVAAAGVAANGQVPMVLVEEHPDIYAWDTEESPAVQPGVPTVYDPTQHPWAKALQLPNSGPNAQLLWDDTFDPAWWVVPAPADRIEWGSSRATWAVNIPWQDAGLRVFYWGGPIDRMPRTKTGEPIFIRVTVQPEGVSALEAITFGGVEVEYGGELLETGSPSEADFSLEIAIDWYDANGDFYSREVIATADPADGEQTITGSAIAPVRGYATISIGYDADTGYSGTWSAYEPWLAWYEPTAQVAVNIPTVPESVILCDYTGAPKAGQVDPRYVQFRLLRGGEDITALAAWSRTLTYGAMNSTMESTGDTNPGRLNITYFEVSSTLDITATYQGRTYTVEHRVRMQKDGAPSTGGGGSGSAGSAYGTVNGSVSGTTLTAIGDEIEVTIGSGGDAQLSASYEYNSNQISGAQTCSTQWYKWNGSAYVAIGSPSGPSTSYVPSTGVNGLGSKNFTDSGNTPGSTQRYRLYGAAGASYIVNFAGDCSVVSS